MARNGSTKAVPRLRFSRQLAPRGTRLIVAACVVLACAPAQAQMTAPAITDPLAPKLQTDPRQPPRFQKTPRSARRQLATPPRFTPVPSGAGDTGFDATNTRAPGTQARPASQANAQSLAPALRLRPLDARSAPSANAQVDLSVAPTPEPVSPYQTPPPALTGGPPVESGRSAICRENAGPMRRSRIPMSRSACTPAPSRCIRRSN